jgi:CPA2 family monovalent cation:H+ antiporter-2
MGDAWLFMLDMVIVLGGAAVLGILCERLRLGSVIGYLLAGVIIGPGVIGFVSTGDVIEVIAEVGVALLLFTIGLEFSWKQLVRFGGRAIVGGAIAVVSVILVSILVSLSFGADWRTGFVVGAAASLGSTAIVLRILRDKSDLDSVHGRFAVAILLTQDIAIIPLVLVVSFLSMRSENLAESLGQALVNTLAFVVGLVLFVSLAIPRLLNENVIARNREIPILIAFSTAVGATWAAHSLGLSPALGAFFAGLLLAEGRFADQMRADVLPLRTLFITVFFVSVGLLADVRWMAENALLVLGTTLTLVFGKTVVTYLSIRPFQPSIVA